MKLTVPTMAECMAEGKQPEILFWVGSAGSYDDRAKKITKAIIINPKIPTYKMY